jgi:hypothetical protein
LMSEEAETSAEIERWHQVPDWHFDHFVTCYLIDFTKSSSSSSLSCPSFTGGFGLTATIKQSRIKAINPSYKKNEPSHH